MGALYIIGVILLVRFIRYMADKLMDEDVKTWKEYEAPNDELSEEFINEYPIEETKTDMQTPKENKTEGTVINTKDLMFETLLQMGCNPQEIEDGAVGVVFQGEKFYMRFGIQIFTLKSRISALCVALKTVCRDGLQKMVAQNAVHKL